MIISRIMNLKNAVNITSYCFLILLSCNYLESQATAQPEVKSKTLSTNKDTSNIIETPTNSQIEPPEPFATVPTEPLFQQKKIATDATHDDEPEEDRGAEDTAKDAPVQPSRRINAIIVHGNKHVPNEAILYRIPYKVGEIFNPQKTKLLINNLYFELKRFSNVTVKNELIGDDRMNLHIFLEEKKPLKDVIFKGNKQLSEKEIRSKVKFEDVPAIDKEELKRYARAIKKQYIDKGYHRVEVDYELRIEEDDTATALFTVREHAPSLVKQIEFKGNTHVSSKKLRSITLTKEDWILGMLDKSGNYHPDRLEADKFLIEQYYQSNGFLYGKVIDINPITDSQTGNIKIVFEIQEGNQYTISDVKASGNDILKDEFILANLPIKPGDIYSREKIQNAIKQLETIWGNLGYAYAHIEPSVQPDDDKKTVSVAFYTELGKQVYLNKLNIMGNKKTRDKVIRRGINLDEGCLITNMAMDGSKNRIESIGFFEQRDGVNWKMTRISEDLADLDLVVKEAKTGSANIKIGFGGAGADLKSPASGFSAELNIADRNLFGSGIQFDLTGHYAKNDKSFLFSMTQPWLFDRPIFGKADLYHRRVGYDELRYAHPINESITGGALTSGFVTGLRNYPFFNDTYIRFNLTFNRIRYEKKPEANFVGIPLPWGELQSASQVYQGILDREFTPGEYVLLAAQCGQDHKNHPMHPSRGHTWMARTEFAFTTPSFIGCPYKIGYNKLDFDFNWYTPLIDEYNLVFHMHGYLGLVTAFKNRVIPYRELYHIGGPASVRGFIYGQIGPQFSVYPGISDSIGGRKAGFVSAELLFPITSDFNMKGVFFYDGGAGWNNPYEACIPPAYLHNNNFDYRHAVGFGIRIYNPMPIKVDWGFKLDPRPGENTYEVHFSTSVDW